MNILLTLVGLLITTNQLDWHPVEDIIQEGIAQGYFSGCVLAVTNSSSTLYKKAFGYMHSPRGLYAPPVTLGMKWDIGALTQVIGVGSQLMRYYDQQRLNTSSLVSSKLPDFDNNGKRYVTIENVMMHNSGIEATYPDPITNDTNFLKQIYTSKLLFNPEAKYLYTELGFVVLGQMVAKMANDTFNSAIFQILIEAGLRDTGFNPTSPAYLVVPSGVIKGQVAQGRTSNQYATILKGVAGNAGLFSTPDNLVTYMQLMLSKGKPTGGSRIFSEEVIDLFVKTKTIKAFKNTRACGWDTVPADNPPCGKKFSPNSFGLSDISGTYMWGDMTKNAGIVFLANGNFPAPRSQLPAFQGRLSDAIMTVLGY